MIIIAGSLSFDPSDREDVLASLGEVTEASRRDAGCVEYFWSEDLESPNTFRFFEVVGVPGTSRRPPGPATRGGVRRAQPVTDHRRHGEHVRGDADSDSVVLTGPHPGSAAP